MTWYYASGGQQMGPVDDAALDDLVRQGVVRDDTLVWRQGMSGWQAHSTARPRPAAPPAAAPMPAPAAPAPMAAAPAPAPWSAAPQAAAASAPQAAPAQEMRFCSNCGRPTPVSQLTTVSGANICASCLPTYPGAGAAAGPAQASQQAPGYQPPPPAYAPPAAYNPAGGYPPAGMVPQTTYGGFWIRFLARVIDGII